MPPRQSIKHEPLRRTTNTEEQPAAIQAGLAVGGRGLASGAHVRRIILLAHGTGRSKMNHYEPPQTSKQSSPSWNTERLFVWFAVVFLCFVAFLFAVGT